MDDDAVVLGDVKVLHAALRDAINATPQVAVTAMGLLIALETLALQVIEQVAAEDVEAAYILGTSHLESSGEMLQRVLARATFPAVPVTSRVQ